jgi:hypothetical protein
LFGFCAILLLAFLPATTFLVRRSMFYELPLVAGYAFIMLLYHALYQVWHGRRPAVRLGIASLAGGLAVGCHPNHIALLGLVAWAAWDAGRTENRLPPKVSRRLIWAAAILPAALTGAGLAGYNFARFGSPFDFGFEHGQNQFFTTGESILQPRFLAANLRWYYLTPPTVTPYMPFVFPGDITFRPPGYQGAEAIHGFFPCTLLVGWILAGAALARRRPAGGRAPLARFSVAHFLGFSVALLFVMSLVIRADRYAVDYQVPLTLLAVIGTGWIWRQDAHGPVWSLWRWGCGALAGLTALFAIFASLQLFELFEYTRPRSFALLGRTLNPPYEWFYRLGFPRPGPVSLQVRFAPQTTPLIEPLVVTGTPLYADAVTVAQYPGNQIQFMFDHSGHGGPASELLKIEPGRDYDVQIEMGSFFPPLGDPYYRDSARLTRKYTLRVALDGKNVLNRQTVFYDSPPWARWIGFNPINYSLVHPRFSGKIREVRRAEPEPPPTRRDSARTVVRYTLAFPTDMPEPQPLASAGVTGHGLLLFVQKTAPDTYRLSIDDWGHGVIRGQTFQATAGEHTLDLVLGRADASPGSPAPTPAFAGGKYRWSVWLDGRLVGHFITEHYGETLPRIVVGANPQGFSSAVISFLGELGASSLTETEIEDLWDRSIRLPTADAAKF